MKSVAIAWGAATVIALAVPASAQPSGAADSKGMVTDLARKWQDAYNRKDAAGIAALYTNTGVYVVGDGILEGHAAIQKQIEEQLRKGGHNLTISTTRTGIAGGAVWGVGEWSAQFGDAPSSHGFWSNVFVRDGKVWKIQMNGITMAATPPEAPGSRPTH